MRSSSKIMRFSVISLKASALLLFSLITVIPACSQSPSESVSMKVDSKRIVITPESLPKPFATSSSRNNPKIVPQPSGAVLNLPTGFEIKVFAEGELNRPRWVIQGANDDVFVSEARSNDIILLRDSNKDGVIDNAKERFKFLSGLNAPFGMAINNGWFYVANTDSVIRYKYQAGQTQIEGNGEKIIDLPGQGYNQHWTRNLLFSKDGKKLYVTVGSQSNVGEEEPRRAAINEYNPDGTNHRVYASGIRNPIGLAWNPANGQLWTAVNERDGLGDDLVPDYVTSVKEGGFYGWPYSYIGKNPEPRMEGKGADLVAKAIVPDVLLEAHCAALGLTFYTGSMFPKEYQGDAFVAMHGSWNRSSLHGYKIVRVPMKNGKHEGGYENFVTGWASNSTNEVWGRPVGLLMMNDGSLLIVDDSANKLWRVSSKK